MYKSVTFTSRKRYFRPAIRFSALGPYIFVLFTDKLTTIVLPIKDHVEMRGTQLHAASSQSDQLCLHLYNKPLLLTDTSTLLPPIWICVPYSLPPLPSVLSNVDPWMLLGSLSLQPPSKYCPGQPWALTSCPFSVKHEVTESTFVKNVKFSIFPR